MKSLPALAVSFFLLLVSAMPMLAADADADWQRVIDLDAGPSTEMRNQDEARAAALTHLNAQEKALRSFLADHPGDAHTFEAKMRLSRLLRIRADFQSSDKARTESRQILDELRKTASTPEQHVEVDFAGVTALMASLRNATPALRDSLLSSVRKFQADHSDDRRLPALLVETATLFDSQPNIKEKLLHDAQPLTTDEELKGRIADDLKRLDFVGKEVPLRFEGAEGKKVDIADYRGKIVLLIFFADWSPPAMAALENLQKTLIRLPRDRVQAIGISLDEKQQDITNTVQRYHITWPVICDGKSWESPLVRSLGINTLPTVWLIDPKGHLRSLKGQDGTFEQVRQLLGE